MHMFLFFFFNDTATTEIYTLSLHDALPIFGQGMGALLISPSGETVLFDDGNVKDCDKPVSYLQQLGVTKIDYHVTSHYHSEDRKSTRLNSSHSQISYAVFCLQKKKRESIYI